jgi:predicted phosphodiesterase
MKKFSFIGFIIMFFACSSGSGPLNMDQPVELGEKDYTLYFDSLASYGVKYGFQTVVPKHDYDIVLSNPTSSSIYATVLCYKDCVGYLSYGPNVTQQLIFEAGVPIKVEMKQLTANTNYTYQFHYKTTNAISFTVSPLFKFSTPQSEGSSYSFAIIADSHLDENCDTATYRSTLLNIQNEDNCFLVDLGDTFMTDKYGQNTYTCAYGQYLAQRYYFGSICHSLPLYFVQGNHDGETGDKALSMTNWSKRIREAFFPNPVSENYFSWEWGDALIIVLDPFTFTSQQGGKDPWQRTLGDIQYHWLENVLKNSSKKYKFVFIHNLVGGLDNGGQARGGAEAAQYWEWGGMNLNGVNEFAQRRSWNEPIHNLLKRYGVQIVFHGHDHLYARQENDGIIYQCVEQPGLKHFDSSTYGDVFGYKNGIISYTPGHIRVTISPSSAKVDYISYKNELLYSYTL